MAPQDHKSANDSSARFGGTFALVSAPAADEGVRKALRGAFACAKDMPDDFDRLLAKLR